MPNMYYHNQDSYVKETFSIDLAMDSGWYFKLHQETMVEFCYLVTVGLGCFIVTRISWITLKVTPYWRWSVTNQFWPNNRTNLMIFFNLNLKSGTIWRQIWNDYAWPILNLCLTTNCSFLWSYQNYPTPMIYRFSDDSWWNRPQCSGEV